jgi:hypothetical protein
MPHLTVSSAVELLVLVIVNLIITGIFKSKGRESTIKEEDSMY